MSDEWLDPETFPISEGDVIQAVELWNDQSSTRRIVLEFVEAA